MPARASPEMRGTASRRGRLVRGPAGLPRSAARTTPRWASGLALRQLGAGLFERAFDQLAVLIGVDLASEDAARGEHDHSGDLRSQLRQRLIVELPRVAATALADPIGLCLRLRLDVGGGLLRGPCRLIGARLRLDPCGGQGTL